MSSFLEPSHPLLSQRAKEVPLEEILSDEIQRLIEQMFEVAVQERMGSEKRSLIGLAAPQIGIDRRIILVDMGVDVNRTQFGELKAFINPDIIWSSPEFVEGREGCFSVDSHVCGIVSRPNSIRITAYDRQGKPVTELIEGFTARIFQHEIDHLDGIRFPDRVGENGILHWVEPYQFTEYRNSWRTWPDRCSWSIWQAMRSE